METLTKELEVRKRELEDALDSQTNLQVYHSPAFQACTKDLVQN